MKKACSNCKHIKRCKVPEQLVLVSEDVFLEISEQLPHLQFRLAELVAEFCIVYSTLPELIDNH